MKTENYLNNLLKANLVLSDYTLAHGDEDEEKVFISLLDKYVYALNDPTITTIFNKLTSSNEPTEIDVYTQILMDVIEDRKKEVEEDGK